MSVPSKPTVIEKSTSDKAAPVRRSRMSKHIKRQADLFTDLDTAFDRRLALQQDILANPALEIGSLGYVARLIAQFGLPHRDQGPNVHNYSRANGDLTFNVTSTNQQAIPFGTIPRILLAYVSTEAALNKSKTVRLGSTVSSFLREELGMAVTGGVNGSITRLKLQSWRLFNCSISVKAARTSPDNKLMQRAAAGMLIATNYADRAATKNADTLWEGSLTLSQEFYESTIGSKVPFDWRIIRGIKDSALAIDLYFWLNYRMYSLKHPTPVPFFGSNSIHEQLGTDYEDTRQGRFNFKAKLAEQLAELQFFWKELRVEPTEDKQSLLLFPSPTSVSPRLK